MQVEEPELQKSWTGVNVYIDHICGSVSKEMCVHARCGRCSK